VILFELSMVSSSSVSPSLSSADLDILVFDLDYVESESNESELEDEDSFIDSLSSHFAAPVEKKASILTIFLRKPHLFSISAPESVL
tara:strand:- start:369 stop:629 length:261 start_codon:yes stop_codon:yes gene_type:complete